MGTGKLETQPAGPRLTSSTALGPAIESPSAPSPAARPGSTCRSPTSAVPLREAMATVGGLRHHGAPRRRRLDARDLPWPGDTGSGCRAADHRRRGQRQRHRPRRRRRDRAAGPAAGLRARPAAGQRPVTRAVARRRRSSATTTCCGCLPSAPAVATIRVSSHEEVGAAVLRHLERPAASYVLGVTTAGDRARDLPRDPGRGRLPYSHTLDLHRRGYQAARQSERSRTRRARMALIRPWQALIESRPYRAQTTARGGDFDPIQSRRKTDASSGLAMTLAVVVLTAAAAPRRSTSRQDGVGHARVDDVEAQHRSEPDRDPPHQPPASEHDQQIGEASKTAQEALQRAQEAGKLAEGKLLYETVLTDDQVRFGFDKAELSDEAKAALDEFAEPAQGRSNDERLHRDPGPHGRHRARGSTTTSSASSGPKRCAGTSTAARHPAAPHVGDLLRRDARRSPTTAPARAAPRTGAWCWWSSSRAVRQRAEGTAGGDAGRLRLYPS